MLQSINIYYSFFQSYSKLFLRHRHGDWVQFNIAVDRRDKLERATNIELQDESFVVSGEKRETGVVAAVKEGYGFIRCAERDARVFFHFSEVISQDEEVDVNSEVEFTMSQVKLRKKLINLYLNSHMRYFI